MKQRYKISAALCTLLILSGCSGEEKNQQIIPDISLGMTKDEVFKVVGSDYLYKEDNSVYGYKNTMEYGYSMDKLDAFDVDIQTQMFFEFENDDKLVTYGYHIGRTGGFNESVYPYEESELTDAYDKIYKQLSDRYGEGTSSEANSDYGVIKENSWEHDEEEIWCVVGVNMWAVDEPESYEKGVNEIVLSCTSK